MEVPAVTGPSKAPVATAIRSRIKAIHSGSRPHLSTDQLRRHAADVKSELVRYRSRTDILEAKLRQLEDELDLVVYPILSLPIEIVSAIFIYCLPAHGRVRPRPLEAPLLLNQISQRWTLIALSIGDLWASIDFSFSTAQSGGGLMDFPNPGALPSLRTWMFRSKMLPISLTIRSTHAQLSPDFLSSISSVAHRVRRLELSILSADFDYLRGVSVNFPALNELALCCRDAHTVPVSIFGSLPRLCQLRIFSDRPWANTSLEMFSHLTKVELERVSAPTVLELLAKCPGLRHLKVDFVDSADFSPTDESPRIAGLHSLVLAASDGHGLIPPVLGHITLPQLKRLDLRHDSDPQFKMLQAFIARSACVLDHLGLWISSEEQASRELDHILFKFPSLGSLDIHAGPHIESVVRLLGEPSSGAGGGPNIVPALTALSLATCDGNVDYNHLLEFLSYRNRLHPIGLDSFHLELCEDEIQMAAASPPAIYTGKPLALRGHVHG
ncbi:hypothetical protein DFH06DRAFT_1386947 [Mycena polygramma]|nr:hypothetical protein DFH06DRAFT_1386947 [Mycena polygramma]